MVSLRRVVSPAPRQEWTRVLAADPHAGPTQTRDWLACLCAAGPFTDASRFYAFDDGTRVVLPLARRVHRPEWLRVERSWPFDWGVGGPVTSGEVRTEHAGEIGADLRSAPALARSVRLPQTAGPGWAAAFTGWQCEARHTQTVDLEAGFERVWAEAFRGSVRRAVRKAERSGLRVEADSTGRLVPLFYELYEQSIRRWATRQHEPVPLARWRAHRANSQEKLQTVADRFGDRCTIWIAWLESTPVAGIVVLRHGVHAKYWRGAMNDLAGPVRANDLLHRWAIERACREGCTHYHMGESRPGSGLAVFKAGFGARSQQVREFRNERVPLSTLDRRARAVAKSVLRVHDA